MTPTEAIILAGGKAERLGEAADGRPKALVHIEGRPLAAYQVALLMRAGVERVIFSVAAGQEELFERELEGLGGEVMAAGGPAPLAGGRGRGGTAGPRRRPKTRRSGSGEPRARICHERRRALRPRS